MRKNTRQIIPRRGIHAIRFPGLGAKNPIDLRFTPFRPDPLNNILRIRAIFHDAQDLINAEHADRGRGFLTGQTPVNGQIHLVQNRGKFRMIMRIAHLGEFAYSA